MDIKELNKTQLILLSLLITFVVSIATGIVTVSLMQQMPKSVPKTINNIIQRTIEKVTTVQVPVPTKSNKVVTKTQQTPFIGDGNVLVSIYANDTEKPTPTTPTVPATSSSNSVSSNTPDTNTSTSAILSDTSTTSINSSNTSNSVNKGDSISSKSSTDINDVNNTSSNNKTTKKESNKVIKSPKALGQGIIISDVGLILVESDILNGHTNFKITLNETYFNVIILKKFSNGFAVLKIISKKDEKKLANKKVSSTTKKAPISKVDN